LENGSPTAHYTLVHTDEGAGGAWYMDVVSKALSGSHMQ